MIRTRLKKYIKLIGGCVATLLLVACNDIGQILDDKDDQLIVPDGMEKITIRIPNYDGGAAQFGTKAFDPKEEGFMSNLYVVAIKCANVDDDGFIVANVDNKGELTTGESYESGTIVLDETGEKWNVVNKSTGQTLKEGVNPVDYLIPEAERRLYTYSVNAVGEDFKLVRVNKGETDYHTFNLALYPGLYRFGIIANADLYVWRTSKISEFTKEQDLRDLILYFSEDTPLTPMHLPMVCHPEEMKYQLGQEDPETKKVVYETIRDVQDATHDVIPICHNYSTRVLATLKFLCAKVRWTILFDKTPGGISEAFGNSWIRFNVDDRYKPIATKIRRYTRLFINGENEAQGGNDALFIKSFSGASTADEGSNEKPDAFTGSTYNAQNGWWSMDINRYYWNEIENENYPMSPNSELTLWDKSTDEWIPQKKKVWQGIVYLPENLETSSREQNPHARTTVLEFPYHTRLNDNDDTPEVEASEPKRIYLFGNDNEKRYEGLYGDREDYEGSDGDNYLTSEVTEDFLLERNYFYDVVAKVVNPDDAEMEIQVFVSILPWHEIDQSIPESSDDNAPKDTNTIIDINAGVNPWHYNGSTSTW